MSNTGNFIQTVVLIISLIFQMIAISISIYSTFSPSWQVVDIREFRAQHHHGLWLDCTRSEISYSTINSNIKNNKEDDSFLSHSSNTRPHKNHYEYYDSQSPLHCTYKFDWAQAKIIEENIINEDDNSAAGEAEHHQFFFWHKAVLTSIICSIIFGGLSLFTGMCSPCFGTCSLVYAILIFLSLISSITADAIFFFAAHRVDNRFVQGLIGTYEQGIGHAFYLHLSSTIILLISFIISVCTSYSILRSSNTQREDIRLMDLPSINKQLIFHSRY
ncbi:Clc protein-like family-containing protein [Strongyloides ratti]|uniref:Clc protein-like family-containing protein n=1 Tax=Strongyloides ratti TaxID=34506 RepID=A0A090LPH1_STRRB|nr:Clc protein-like family-containing protein [Strongyloides ratti]CEF71656.1 Clc protein-like family-containing protein [Strongyloides ratti]